MRLLFLAMLRNEKMCLRKRLFWSAGDAQRRADTIGRSGTAMRVYHCPNCRMYHLTSRM